MSILMHDKATQSIQSFVTLIACHAGGRLCQFRGRLCLSGAFRVARYDLDAVGVDGVRVVQLEVDVFDNEGPDFVAEAVRVEMALQVRVSAAELHDKEKRGLGSSHLEAEAGLDLVGQHFGDGLVEVHEDLHGKLRLDAALRDERVQRVCEGATETAMTMLTVMRAGGRRRDSGEGYLLLRYSS